jgi:hypothetical protein
MKIFLQTGLDRQISDLPCHEDPAPKVHHVQVVTAILAAFRATPDAVNVFDLVRIHLHNTFRKTGTNRQSELVKPIAGID